ncbi:G protein pathway suppressor 2 isoform X2 [Sitophilus oryzae]|uniref:G protein pathway suppressor 2 isoform X2 n=1 Tax=Sitophilus oryzae TaxID=7048 RepID=A0A6J2XX49_SITOR|nr:G protein pathway suppressor 2 isoform X2 [Sitophilus oryzae]
MPAAIEDGAAPTASTSANETSNSKNPEVPDRDQQMWKVLKAYILRDRARKRQEREAEVEEERLRKEREAREQQDVMTLGETREHISQLEAKLQQFKDEKHQLFLQLKKVLNEDDNRRRQLIKDAFDTIVPIRTMPQGVVPHQQPPQQPPPPPQQQQQPQQALYVHPSQAPGRIQTIAELLPQPQPATVYNKAALKRPRSPSPPLQAPVSMYQGYTTYKSPAVGTSSYQASPQKAPQYSNQPSAFYPVAPQDISIYYPLPREAPRPMPYETPPRPTAFQMDHKINEHYSALRTATSQHGHIIHPGTGLTINPGQPTPKAGSITAGYPVRTQTQYQQAGPASLYTTQSRQMYQSYPPRE